MAIWMADGKFFIYGARIRARDYREANIILEDLADKCIFNTSVPLNTEFTDAFVISDHHIYGSEDSHGIPLLGCTVLVLIGNMTVEADSEEEARKHFCDALNEWAPNEFPIEGRRVEFQLTAPELIQDDDCSPISKSWRPKSSSASRKRSCDAKGRNVFKNKSPAKSKTARKAAAPRRC